LVLRDVLAETASLKAASDVSLVQIAVFNFAGKAARTGENQIIEHRNLQKSQIVEFDAGSPYSLFTIGAFLPDEEKEPFEGWGIVIKPVSFEATLTAPETARPGEEIDVYVEIPPDNGDAAPVPASCWLLVYDVRLEHESPVPKLAKRIYESVRDAGGNLVAHSVTNAMDARWSLPGDVVTSADAMMMPSVAMARGSRLLRSSRPSDMGPPPVAAAVPMTAQGVGAMPELEKAAVPGE
jgi:hypothetical protein